MKQLILILSLFFIPFLSDAQLNPYSYRSGQKVNIADYNLKAVNSLTLPRYSDTALANVFSSSLGLLDSCGSLISTWLDNKIWKRSCNPKMWVEVGGGTGDIATVKNFQNPASLRSSNFNTTVGDLVAQVFSLGGAQYKWNPLSGVADDGFLIIKPTAVSGSGRWEKVFTGSVRLSQAGLKYDGTNEAVTLQSLLTLSSVNEIILESGNLNIGSSLLDIKGKRIKTENGAFFTGTGSIINAYVEASNDAKVFASTIKVGYLNRRISAIWFGAKADNGATNNRPIFQRLADSLPLGTNCQLFVPEPSYANNYYYLDSTFVIKGKYIHLLGGGGAITKTILKWPAGVEGIKLSKEAGGYRGTIIENFTIEALGQDSRDGKVSFNAANARKMLNGAGDPNAFFFHGIESEIRCQIINCSIRSFSGHGVVMKGFTSNSTNSDLSVLRNIDVEYCYGHGFYFTGDDANQIKCYDLNTNSNTGVGYYDNSFLGNQVFGGHAATNGEGAWWVLDPNACANIIGSYTEGDSHAIVLAQNAQISGGLHAVSVNAPSGGQVGFYQQGKRINGIYIYRQDMASAMGFDENQNNNVSYYFSGNGGATFRFQPVTYDTTLTSHFGLTRQDSDLERNIQEVMEAGSQYKTYDDAIGTNTTRTVGHATQSFRDFGLTGRRQYSAASATGIFNRQQNILGDIIWNKAFDGSNPVGWSCSKPGMFNTPVYSQGLTASTDGSVSIYLSAPNTELKEGDGILINGIKTWIYAFNSAKTIAYSYYPIPVGSGLSISYATPEWTPFYAVNPANYLTKSDTLRSGIIPTYKYVDSLFKPKVTRITSLPDGASYTIPDSTDIFIIDFPSAHDLNNFVLNARPNGGKIRILIGGSIAANSDAITNFSVSAPSGKMVYGSITAGAGGPVKAGDVFEYTFVSQNNLYYRIIL